MLSSLFIFLWAQTSPRAMPQLKICADRVQSNQAEDAVKACKLAVGIDSNSGAAHMLLGQAYLAMRSAGMVAEAKAEFQQALDIDPSLVWARFYLARVYIDIGRAGKAKEELDQAIEMRPGVGHFYSLSGEAERKLGHPEAAIELQRKAIAADPKLSTAYYYAGLAYMDLKQDDAAIAELESCLKSPYVAPEFYLTLGSLYTKRKKFAEAEQLCRKAIALDPVRPESYLNLAQLFNAQKLSNKALDALRLALPPGKTFAASPYYQQLQADIHFEFGYAYLNKGAKKEAVQSFERCLEMDAGRAATHRKLAELYRAQGKTVLADEHAEAAGKIERTK
jgi:tetratricopeptide (TPR) repeat protein